MSGEKDEECKRTRRAAEKRHYGGATLLIQQETMRRNYTPICRAVTLSLGRRSYQEAKAR
jgi:hypothetical protein